MDGEDFLIMNEYFSHDYRSRSDKKLVNLSMRHGMAGVGIFWCVVEMLYEEGGYIKRSEYERIAFELRDHPDSIKSVIENFELFEFDDEKFWSKSAIKRIKTREEKSEKARNSVQKRWNNTNVLQSNNDGNTIKEKKIKEKKIIIPHINPPWKTSFPAYLLLVSEAKNEILSSPEVVKKRILSFWPNLDVQKSLELSIQRFWGTEAGWKNKKKCKGETIDMVETLLRTIDKNKVFLPKELISTTSVLPFNFTRPNVFGTPDGKPPKNDE